MTAARLYRKVFKDYENTLKKKHTYKHWIQIELPEERPTSTNAEHKMCEGLWRQVLGTNLPMWGGRRWAKNNCGNWQRSSVIIHITFMAEGSTFSPTGFVLVGQCFMKKNKQCYTSCNTVALWSFFKGQWLQSKSAREGSISAWASFMRPLSSFLPLVSNSVDPSGPEAVLDQPRNTNQH